MEGPAPPRRFEALRLPGFRAFVVTFMLTMMTQTIVLIHAPSEARGRVLGLFNMSAAGLRAFSGVTVGIVGSLATVHLSLSLAAGAFMLTALALLARFRGADGGDRFFGGGNGL
jgi:hypothetical protein